jgi:hypothetical protein
MSGPLLEKQFDKIIKSIKKTSSKRIKLDRDSNQNVALRELDLKLDDNCLIKVEDNPTIERFETIYFKQKVPCIIANQMSHWPAMKKWRFN